MAVEGRPAGSATSELSSTAGVDARICSLTASEQYDRRVDDPPRRARTIVTIGVLGVVAPFAVNQVRVHPFGPAELTWLCVAVFASIVAAGIGASHGTRRRRSDALNAIREAAERQSERELAASDVISTRIDAIIPVKSRDRTVSAVNVTELVAVVLQNIPDLRLVAVGYPGAGKSIFLHRVATEFNARSATMAAVVVPLAAYDWAGQTFTEWLAQEIAELANVDTGDVSGLLTQRRLFLLLDGIDAVPDSEILRRQGFPVGETPLLDRIRPRSSLRQVDPRRQLIERLNRLPGFVITARPDKLSETELVGLKRFSTVELRAIEKKTAFDLVRSTAIDAQADEFSSSLRTATRTPLYLRLASQVCVRSGLPPRDVNTVEAVQRWLWDHYLEWKLSSHAAADLAWDAVRVRRWLVSYAAAATDQDAISFRRWALLYGPRVRLALRGAKALASAAILGAFASLFTTATVACAVTALTLVGFACAGEGAATKPLAPQRFGVIRFLVIARAQWPYAIVFTVSGAVFGALVANTWGSFIRLHSDLSLTAGLVTGTLAGFLLGFSVPTLYELNYVRDTDLYRRRRRRGTVLPTILSSGVIGGSAGLIVALALFVAFRSDVAFAAVPVCVALAMVDTLGLPCAAVALWAVQRKGPVRVEVLLSLAVEVGLARSYALFYFLEHSELQRFLMTTETHVPPNTAT
jgi:hypothetical protein